MKIKRLIIHNIASIEEGEIDFERDLIERDSGNPASLFLITGDTGSGKSVILDCISMSLYGTTPRVKSVNGIKNNSYRNNDGEEISVNDITQYTRIGISWKDSCYCELYFTGNDNVDYVSRYSLGRTSHRNYRKPEWTLKIGNSQIIENRKEEIREKIQSAVGLTFEQFSRMAMLAQGQFETFLTGKKEERERILEQLTATDIFSRYGEAISSIFKNSKQEYETSKKILDELSKNILDKETIDKLTEEQSVKSAQASTCHKETVRIRQCIKNTEDLINANKELTTLQGEDKKLREIEESIDFRERIAVLNLWDTTTTPREYLSDKIKATESLISDKKTLQEKKTFFNFLSNDFSQREREAKNAFVLLEKQRLWIESQSPLKELFAKSSAVINNINRYSVVCAEISKKESEIEKVNAELEDLSKSISTQKDRVEEKNKLSVECQKTIDEKINERAALRPSALREEKDKMVKRQSCLKELTSRLEAINTEIEESQKAENEISKMVFSMAKLTEISEKASAECIRLEKVKEESESRFRTMLQSVEDNFKAIRRQLAEEHSKHCPLCGQSIEDKFQEWNNENYFSGILSPLEEEKKKSAAEYASSKIKADEAKRNLDILSGELKAKENDLKKRKNKISKNEKEIHESIITLDLQPSDDLNAFIAGELITIEGVIKSNSELLERVDKLQKEIDALLKRKSSIDEVLKAEEKKLQNSLRSLAKKDETIKQSRQRAIELKNEKKDLILALSENLSIYDSEWQKDPCAIASNLKKDADNYLEKTTSYTKEEADYKSNLKTLESIANIKETLSVLLQEYEPLELNSALDNNNVSTDEILKIWYDFHVLIETIKHRITDNESIVKDREKKLCEFYQQTGTTETTLRQLIKASDEIQSMRKAQDIHVKERQSLATRMEEASKKKQENLTALDIKDESEIENPEILKARVELLENQYRELSLSLGVIKEKLEADAKNRKETDIHLIELENKRTRLEKWDKMNRYFGGTRFRTLVQSHILRPLLHNANIYLRQITDHYTLTCSDENEQLSILVNDRYNNNEPRSVTVLSGAVSYPQLTLPTNSRV